MCVNNKQQSQSQIHYYLGSDNNVVVCLIENVSFFFSLATTQLLIPCSVYRSFTAEGALKRTCMLVDSTLAAVSPVSCLSDLIAKTAQRPMGLIFGKPSSHALRAEVTMRKNLLLGSWKHGKYLGLLHLRLLHSTTLKTWDGKVEDVVAPQPKSLARCNASSEAIYGTYGGSGAGVLNCEI
ncbi:hypothetical protein Tco_1207588, partial [Tanacetum coccineum]